MKNLIFLFSVLLFSLARADSREITLVLGEEKKLPAAAGRLWIESPKHLKASASGNHLVLKPLKPGRVQIRTSQGPQIVEIVSPATYETFQALSSAIEKMVGPSARLLDGEAVLEGRLHRVEDYRRIVQSLPSGARWVLRARIPEALREDMVREIQKRLVLPQPPALVFGDEIQWLVPPGALSPSVPQNGIHELGLRLVSDSEAVNTEPVIRVEIAVAEVRRDALKNYGVSLPTAAQASLLPDGSWSRSELKFGAQLMEKAGHARLLAKPTLLCRSGKEAEFVAGGEFPIKIFNSRVQDVIWKRYGIVVTVKPKADRSGRISMGLSVEISSIDGSRQVDGIPGLLTNRVASHFDLTRPRVIALSGLIKHEDSTSRDGLLGLSKLPVLGPLFSSRAWMENRTELVIFVRPEIVKELI